MGLIQSKVSQETSYSPTAHSWKEENSTIEEIFKEEFRFCSGEACVLRLSVAVLGDLKNVGEL